RPGGRRPLVRHRPARAGRTLRGPPRRRPDLHPLTPRTIEAPVNFLSNLPVGRKLMLAFTAVLTAIMAMGAVVFVQLIALERAGQERSVANRALRETGAAEFFLSRQENSFRGF